MKTTKKPSQPRPVRARKMWTDDDWTIHRTHRQAMQFNVLGEVRPVFLLNLSTPELYDAAVEQLAKAIASYSGPEGYDGCAIAALTSLGITRPPEGGKEGK